MNPFTYEARYYDIFHTNKDYKAEALKIKKEFPDVKTILEVGCGTGNLSVELEKLGFEVLGIDNSKQMLKYYKGKTGILADIRFFKPKTQFDLLLAHYDVFNYLSPSEVLDIKRRKNEFSKDISIETWKGNSVTLFTHRKANDCHRIRLGLSFNNKAYLLYIFWGRGLAISKHVLNLNV